MVCRLVTYFLYVCIVLNCCYLYCSSVACFLSVLSLVHINYPLCRSAWVECSSPSVCLSVCPEHNSKTNDHKVFKLGAGNDLGIPWKWYCYEVQRSQGTKFISHTRTLLEPLFIDIRQMALPVIYGFADA